MKTSKLMIKLDYAIGIFLILAFLVCILINTIFEYKALKQCIEVITPPVDLGQVAVVLTAWIAQLGISSTAYYFMCKSDHAIEIPANMIKELPQEMIDKINDPSDIIIAAITTK